jgi:putative acetyltransferase
VSIADPVWRLRAEDPADAEAIHRVHAAAFARRAEADLVGRLRAEADPYLGLVAETAGGVVAHVAFSPVAIERGRAAHPLLALGPLAVDPPLQGRGAGSALVEAGLRACAERGAGLVFVLGHPTYYPRFGFEPAATRNFFYRDATHAPAFFVRAFFVRELVPGAAEGLSGRVEYHRAFEGL